MLHPASLLVLWGGFAIALQAVSLPYLIAVASVALLLGALKARDRLWRLLRRSRWLLLSLAVLFLFFTPGEYLIGPLGSFGVSYEGMAQAGGHVSLLLALLASLAIMHEGIGTDGILAGLYGVLRFLGISHAAVVRMSLVLDFVEKPPVGGWRGWLAAAKDEAGGSESVVTLRLAPLRWPDRLVMALVGCGVLLWLVIS